MSRASRFIHDNSLTLAFAGAFLLTLVGQAASGLAEVNNQLVAADLQPVSVAGSDFAVDVTENWQSEYLQFFLYTFGTVWLLQRGSPESKSLDRAGPESDREQKVGPHATADSPRWARASGPRRALYSRSLGIVMALLFLGSWLTQSVTGVAAFNPERHTSTGIEG
ncbi:hypothetical protein GCM10010495_79670 [Kitasatospora herbaricolor]|uniref:DUF6766 family protein n=1 Tax=Kitasatospora herbaricolor TaxID=68217 RepID=UPI00174B3447|nr:DUF6766 family protein [Kitasatospora herbaricolor]MDQ0305943.1 hypothetical protein [Kitasatospora herbaricolor]GGV49955.1 hypothetical protein GCM10010495_79670 [Kitasatospora herbaricolor]